MCAKHTASQLLAESLRRTEANGYARGKMGVSGLAMAVHSRSHQAPPC